jgi:hypothetical protein
MRCLLITSQYYNSRYCFICEHNEDTLENQGKSLIEELEKYKRAHDDTDEIDYGDFNSEWFRKDRKRLNVNDTGDIYFEVYDYANRCMQEALKYQEASRMQSRGYQRKDVMVKISEHHDYGIIKSIIEKYFRII